MRAVTLPVAVMLAAALAGCSGDDGGGSGATLPPVSEEPSASASATPTGAAGDVPEEARAATREGAAAFARYFYGQVEAAYEASEPGLLSALVSQDCSTCRDVLASLDRLKREQLRVNDYSVDVVDVLPAPYEAGADSATVTSTISLSEYVEVDPSGAEKAREPAQRLVQDVVLERTESGWLVSAVTSA